MNTVPAGNEQRVFALMGASNLARGDWALERCLRSACPQGASRILRALGPGRGFCAEGGFMNIRYRPIRDCGIVDAAARLAEDKNNRVTALMTDIGNDILYGVSAEEIIDSLRRMASQLGDAGADVWVSAIHVDMENDVGESRFNNLKRIFFPGSSVTYASAKKAVQDINAELRDGVSRRWSLISGLKAYCGADKIHYHLLKSSAAWTAVARKLLEPGNAPEQIKVKQWDIQASLLNNLARIFFRDMPGLRARPDWY